MRSWLVNLGLLILSLALGAGGAEAFLRVFYPVSGALYETDDRVLYRLIPGARHLYRPIPANGNAVLVKIDRRGFRGDGFSEPRRGPRIAVYGDSFVEAEFSPLKETFVVRLQQELRERLGHPHLEAVNAGVAGYGPDQAALRMEKELTLLQPDLLVFCVFTGNDFGDIVRNKLFHLSPQGQLIENRPAMASALRRSFEDARRVARRPALVRAAATAWEALRAPALPTEFPHYVDQSLDLRRQEYLAFMNDAEVVENVFWDGYDADIALDPTSPSARLKSRLMTGVLSRIDRIARQRNVPWLLVVIPDPIDVAAADFELQVDERKYPAYDPRRLSQIVTGAARELGIAHVDLFETLTEKHGERLFFRYGDNHWNAAGQAKAAAAVAEAVAGGVTPLSAPTLSASR